MTAHTDDDRELREAFAKGRRADANWIPGFQQIRRGRLSRHPNRVRWWRWAAAGVAAVAIATIIAKRRAEEPSAWLEAIGPRRSSTDFLLEVNGAEFLRTVPSIGRTEGWFPEIGVSEGQRL